MLRVSWAKCLDQTISVLTSIIDLVWLTFTSKGRPFITYEVFDNAS